MESSKNTSVEISGCLNVSDDGYLRIKKNTLQTIELVHLMSGLTSCEMYDLNESSTTTINGYTEWISNTSPVISLSWDWYIQTMLPPPQYLISGKPFSNVMLISDEGEDLGHIVTNRQLLKLINDLSWQLETSIHIEMQH